MTDGTDAVIYLQAGVSGEIKPEDILLAPGVNLNVLKAGDEYSVGVVVEVPIGRSKRGWNYKQSAIQAELNLCACRKGRQKFVQTKLLPYFFLDEVTPV
jgi:hypothetical protein